MLVFLISFILFFCSVQNLEIIEPFHSALLGTSNKKRSLFHTLKTTKTIGGYVHDVSVFRKNCFRQIYWHRTLSLSAPWFINICKFGSNELFQMNYMAITWNLLLE